MQNSLGMIGGVGPLASAYFYEMIINMTDASMDQEHINMIILSHASIPDRTAYILGKSMENPYPYLLEDVKTLDKMGVKEIVIPCNTSCYFHEELQKNTKIPIYNLVEETVKYIHKNGIQKVMILATQGTIESHLYQDMCEKYHVEYEVPNEDIQKKVMFVIYDRVKAGKEVDRGLWNEITSSTGAQAFIMGCTELSVVKKNLQLPSTFVDPLEIAAKHILNLFDKKEKER